MRYIICRENELPSTNTALRQRATEDPALPSGTVLVARVQTQGRGRRSRCWISKAGENLTFSLLLRGAIEPRRLPSASMAAAAAVAGLLEDEGLTPVLKWPNDVLVNGKKICGILSEGISGGVIVGIGLNVNMQSAEGIDQPATSLWMETGARRDPDRLLETLLGHLSVRLEAWGQGGFAALRADWERLGAGRGRPVKVLDGDSVKTGRFEGYGPDGELLLRDGSGAVRPVWAGDLSV